MIKYKTKIKKTKHILHFNSPGYLSPELEVVGEMD